MTFSRAQKLATLPADERRRFIDQHTAAEAAALLASWDFWARPEQRPPAIAKVGMQVVLDADGMPVLDGDGKPVRIPPGAWRWWALVTGRGFGKNRTASEWVADRCEQFAARRHPHLVGLLNRSFDAVQSLQIRGESGLAAVCERRGISPNPTRWFYPLWPQYRVARTAPPAD